MNLKEIVDSSKYEHSQRVAQISALLAQKAGYRQSEVLLIEQAALYHDIGKEAIPTTILNKPGRLTPEEFAIIKTHTDKGHEQLMEGARILSIAAEIAKTHHERPDGSGYLHLPGREIHPYASLISVADVFDALISKRVYKDAWDVDDICALFQQQAGLQFEQEYVHLLFSLLDEVLALYKSEQNDK